MIQFLLQLGAHPDVIDFAGRTALMHAAEYGHIDALQLLRHAKANAKIQDLEGRGTSVDERHAELHIVRLLRRDSLLLDRAKPAASNVSEALARDGRQCEQSNAQRHAESRARVSQICRARRFLSESDQSRR